MLKDNYYNKKYDNWKYSIDNEFCKEVFETRDEAMDAAFEALEMLLSKKANNTRTALQSFKNKPKNQIIGIKNT